MQPANIHPILVTFEVLKWLKSKLDKPIKKYFGGTLIYDGNIKNGLEEGKGTAYYPNGNKAYIGEWKNGRFHGKGKLYDMDGNLEYSGKWENGDYAS